jgi:hypothetical protein
MYDCGGKKLDIGDRVIIVRSCSGNEGRICEVIDTFDPRNLYDGKKVAADCTVIIKSMGSPLNKISANNSIRGVSMIGPICPAWLKKLPTVKEPDLELVIEE